MNLPLKFRPLKPDRLPTPDIGPISETLPAHRAEEPIIGLTVTLTGALGDEPAGIDLSVDNDRGRYFIPFGAELRDGCLDLARVRQLINHTLGNALVRGMQPERKAAPPTVRTVIVKENRGWLHFVAGVLTGLLTAIILLG